MTQSKSKETLYPTFFVQFVIANLVAVYVFIEGQSKPLWDVLTDPNTYIAIIFSIAIAFALMMYIHCFTLLLDHKIPLENGFNKRLAFQLLVCALVPVHIDLAIVKVYMWLFNVDFEASRYTTSEFPLAKILIYLMNGWYMNIQIQNLKNKTASVPDD
ncbi:hypothetical protein ASE92_15845 [Pedobacter sp. Leaf41]|uniref:hypothetical protein n=1 Tax=Pedobacter sp. Leaf41 TaxID=1736218 RepID=UPI0007031999|nr:hypothetical protein [Pedobacter sp. Leaf41]KQN34096.1 hypothetical protein ASE92_15845 [Pedobacter sp. Leaf41]